MSLKDLKLEFSDKQAITGTSATSTNTLDLGLERNNLSGNVHGGGYLNVQCCKDAAPVAERATGKFTFEANPVADNTIGIDDTVYTFVASDAGDDEILLGATLADTMKNIVAKSFGPDVTFAITGDDEITVTAVTPGTDGNGIQLKKNSSNISISGTYLSGGTASNVVTAKLQDSDNGTDFTDVVGGSVTITDPVAGSQACIRLPVLKRYVKVAYGATRSLTDGKWDAYIGAPIAKH